MVHSYSHHHSTVHRIWQELRLFLNDDEETQFHNCQQKIFKVGGVFMLVQQQHHDEEFFDKQVVISSSTSSSKKHRPNVGWFISCQSHGNSVTTKVRDPFGEIRSVVVTVGAKVMILIQSNHEP